MKDFGKVRNSSIYITLSSYEALDSLDFLVEDTWAGDGLENHLSVPFSRHLQFLFTTLNHGQEGIVNVVANGEGSHYWSLHCNL